MKYQKKIKPDFYDVIVIGSEMAGLVTVANFVSEGLSVLVLEQHFIAGGATTMFKRENFMFEAGGHRFSGIQNPEGVLAKLLKKINKTVKVEPINPSYVVRSGDKILKQLVTNQCTKTSLNHRMINRYNFTQRLQRKTQNLQRHSILSLINLCEKTLRPLRETMNM